MTTLSTLRCLSGLLTTRGRFGKDSSSIDSRFKVKQKHCTIWREDLVQTAKTLWSSSRKHGRYVLRWHLSGHETAIRSNSHWNSQRYQDAHSADELKKDNGTLNSPSPSKGTSTTCSWDQQRRRSLDRAGVRGRRSAGCSSGTTG